MKRLAVILSMFVLTWTALSACGAMSEAVEAKPETADLSIDAALLTGEPTFIDAESDGIAMQLIALKAEDEVRLAFNTCQACQGSPWAWFEYLEDGKLQCQNCLQSFGLEVVGTEDAIGCCPITITNFTVEDDVVTVPGSVLSDNAFRFKNWKQVGP